MFDDSDGELGNSADFAGEILAEAILSTSLNKEERKALERKLAPIAAVPVMSYFGLIFSKRRAKTELNTHLRQKLHTIQPNLS